MKGFPSFDAAPTTTQHKTLTRTHKQRVSEDMVTEIKRTEREREREREKGRERERDC